MNTQMDKKANFMNQNPFLHIGVEGDAANHFTFLHNGSFPKKKITEMFPMPNQTKKNSYLMFIDFKNLETLHKHLDDPSKERLLGMIANRLGICIRENDAIYQIGRDEFVLLLKIQSLDELEQISEQIKETLRRPFYFGSLSLTVWESASVSYYPQV